MTENLPVEELPEEEADQTFRDPGRPSDQAPAYRYVITKRTADPEPLSLRPTEHIWPELAEQLEELRYHAGSGCIAVTDGGAYYGLLWESPSGAAALLIDNIGGSWALSPLKRGPAGDQGWRQLNRWELGEDYREAFELAGFISGLGRR